MKYYNLLHIALASIAMTFSPACGMDWMTQSTIFPPSESTNPPLIGQQEKQTADTDTINLFRNQIKNLSDNKQTIYKSIINDIEKKLTSPKNLTRNTISTIDYTIKMINNQDIGSIIKAINSQKTSLKNKINILTRLSTLPRPSIPLTSGRTEQRELTSWINNTIRLEHATESLKKKDALLSLKTKTKNIRQNSDNTTLDDLREYKTTLETYINSLREPKNDQELLKKNNTQETLEAVTKRIKLLETIQNTISEYKNIILKESNQNNLQAAIDELKKYLPIQQYYDSSTVITNITSPLYKEIIEELKKYTLALNTNNPSKDNTTLSINHFKDISNKIDELNWLLNQDKENKSIQEMIESYKNKINNDSDLLITQIINKNNIFQNISIDVIRKLVEQYFDNSDLLKPYKEKVNNAIAEQERLEQQKTAEQKKAEEQEKIEQERVKEEQRVANIEAERLENERINQEIDIALKLAEEKFEQEKKQYYAKREQQRLAEQEKREQQRQAEQEKQRQAEQEKQRLAEQEKQRLAEQEKREQQRQWRPWITNGITTIQQRVTNFFNYLRNYRPSWWPF